MPSIPISEAHPGMILRQPVTPNVGKSLGVDGDVLTRELIDRFVREGITQITVERNASDQSEEPENPEDQIREMINHRFHRFDQNPLMQSIKHAAEKHLLQAHPPPQ